MKNAITSKDSGLFINIILSGFLLGVSSLGFSASAVGSETENVLEILKKNHMTCLIQTPDRDANGTRIPKCVATVKIDGESIETPKPVTVIVSECSQGFELVGAGDAVHGNTIQVKPFEYPLRTTNYRVHFQTMATFFYIDLDGFSLKTDENGNRIYSVKNNGASLSGLSGTIECRIPAPLSGAIPNS